MSRRLLLSSSFPPTLGGLELYVEHVAGVFAGDIEVVAGRAPGQRTDDDTRPYRVHRFDRVCERLTHREAFKRLERFVSSFCGDGPPLLGVDRFSAVLAANRNMLRWSAAHAAGLPQAFGAPSIVFCGAALPSGILARLIARRTGAPYVVFAHGAEILRAEKPFHHRALLVAVLRGAARVAAVSAFTAGVVRDLGVAESRIVRTPPGIDPAPYLAASGGRIREAYGLEGRRVILTHGRLDPRKGHDVVIDALPRIAGRCPDVSYLITGTGASEDALKARAARVGVADRVVFAGRMADQDLGDLYAACDVFVMLSRRLGTSVEGFGIVALEAAASGRPVVAGRSGGVSDAVQDGVTGILVDPESREEVAATLGALLEDPERRRAMGAAGRERVRHEFDLRAFGDRIRAVDRSVTEGAQRRGETRSPSRLSG